MRIEDKMPFISSIFEWKKNKTKCQKYGLFHSIENMKAQKHSKFVGISMENVWDDETVHKQDDRLPPAKFARSHFCKAIF